MVDRQRDLEGKRVLVTAGPTQEAIDPVRFISNHSMGYAIAEVARDRGARVVLVSGPVSLEAPEGVELVSIVSAQDLFDAVSARYAEFDAVVAAAAVADYRPKTVADNKMKKKDGDCPSSLNVRPIRFPGLARIVLPASACAASRWKRAMCSKTPAANSRAKTSI